MTERRRTYGRGTRKRAAEDQSSQESPDKFVDANPYLEAASEAPPAPRPRKPRTTKKVDEAAQTDVSSSSSAAPTNAVPANPAPTNTPSANDSSSDEPSPARGRKRGSYRPRSSAQSDEASSASSDTSYSPPPAADNMSARDPEHVRPSDSGLGQDTAPSEPFRGEDNTGESGGNEYRNNGNFRGGRYRRFKHRKQQGQGHHQNPNQNPGQDQHQGQSQGGERGGQQGGQYGSNEHRPHYNKHNKQNQNNPNNSSYTGRRPQQNRRHKYDNTPRGPIGPVVVEGEATGWFDAQRDAGFIRNASNSYLTDPGDPFVSIQLVRQYGLRRGDLITASIGRDQRNRIVVAEIISVNNADPAQSERRPEFQSLVASYPDRKLTLETGKPAKGGPELTRRAIDLIAPIGYGQRALIVAPARAGKTMLLQAVIEGIAINHPEAALFVLLVDERPEEVSDMITLGYGEVIASSFDMPAARHTDVAEMTLERARRLVELGQDVVIVLDSITRLARAYNTVERGTGRTLSGGLDSSAMAKPKAFFGSARSVAEEHGGGSLTIIATALVETGSRMDDVIFEEFKGTGNCEIKLDRSLAEKRIFPAIDIAITGTRREDKLFQPEQLEHVYTLRRGLQQMPPSSGMEWLIKRIAATVNNDGLLTGL